jgi:Arc/MetJ family transcription regulator
MESRVATVNFSVPDEVKTAFDKAFGDHNKSAIIAELMRRAVRERQLQIKREKLLRQLGAARSSRPAITGVQIRRTRAAERP